MNKKIRNLGFVFGISLEAIAFCGSATLTSLQEKISIDRPRIFFRDIVECNGDQETCAEVLNISVAQSPLPNETLRIIPDTLKSILNAENFSSVEIESFKRIEVRSLMQQVQISEIETRLLQYIKPLVQSKPNIRINALKLHSSKKIMIFPGEYKIKMPTHFIDSESSLAQIVQVFREKREWPITLTQDLSGISNHTHLKATIKVDADLATYSARVDIKAQSLLTPDKIEPMWTPTTKVSKDTLFFSAVGLIGKEAKRAISAGSIITRSSIVEEIQVQRGSTVAVEVINGATSLRSEAKALDPGANGDEIRVYYGPAKKTIQAKIVGPNRVEVRL